MNKIVSRILIVSGAALLIVACVLYTYNRIFDYRAGLRAQKLLDQMMAEVDWELPPIADMVYTPPPPPAPAPAVVESDDQNDVVEAVPETISSGAERPPLDIESVTYGGSYISYETPAPASSGWTEPTYSTLGILSIPKLNVRLPVIDESTDANLKISCCRISGIANDKPNRLVIVGHNIWSHFKGLDTLEVGDQIAFTARDGVTYYYSATEIIALYKTEGAEVLVVDGWDITLITCKTDNTWRTVVRFAEITEQEG